MYIELDGEKEEFLKAQNYKYWNKPMSQEYDENRENIDRSTNHLENSPFDYLKLDDKTPDMLLEFLGILSSEYNKGTESLLKTLKKERDNCFETTADNIDYDVKVYFPMKFEALRRYY